MISVAWRKQRYNAVQKYKKALKSDCKEKYQVDLGSLFQKSCVQPTVLKAVKPRKINDDDTSIESVDTDAYKEELKLYVQDIRKMQLTLKVLYAIILGQCSSNAEPTLKVAIVKSCYMCYIR